MWLKFIPIPVFYFHHHKIHALLNIRKQLRKMWIQNQLPPIQEITL